MLDRMRFGRLKWEISTASNEVIGFLGETYRAVKNEVVYVLAERGMFYDKVLMRHLQGAKKGQFTEICNHADSLFNFLKERLGSLGN